MALFMIPDLGRGGFPVSNFDFQYTITLLSTACLPVYSVLDVSQGPSQQASSCFIRHLSGPHSKLNDGSKNAPR